MTNITKTIQKNVHKLVKVAGFPNEMNMFITSSFNASYLLNQIFTIEDLDLHGREYFIVLGLNRRNKVVVYDIVSQGGMTSTCVDIRAVFSTLITHASHSCIISHNHPSGNRLPSEQDKSLTRKLVKAGEILDIPVLDHIIIAAGEDNSYFSFSDEGIL